MGFRQHGGPGEFRANPTLSVFDPPPASAALFTAFQSNLTFSSAISQLLIPPIILVFTFLASIFRPNLLEHHPPRVYAIRALGILLILAGVIKLVL